MPRIGRFPAFGKRFFRQARKLVGSCHFAHFWRAVVALVAMQGRRSLKKLEAACRNHRSRQSIGLFLTEAQWDAPDVLAETARACEAKGYHYVGVAKKNRNFFPDGHDRDKRKLASYGKNLLSRQGRTTACRGKLWDDNINSMEQGLRNRRVGKKLKQLVLLDT